MPRTDFLQSSFCCFPLAARCTSPYAKASPITSHRQLGVPYRTRRETSGGGPWAMANGSGITLTALSALSAALLGWIGLGMNQQKNRAEENARLTQVALGRLTEERQRVAGQRDIELKVYDAVVSALETGS